MGAGEALPSPAQDSHGPALPHAALRRNIGTIRLTLARRNAPDWVPVAVPADPGPH